MDDYPTSYRAGNLPENRTGYSGNYRDCNPAAYSPESPDDRPEKNLESSGAGNSPDCWEGNSADAPAECTEGHLPSLRNS